MRASQCFLFLIFWWAVPAFSQVEKKMISVQDMRTGWLQFHNGEYKPWTGDRAKAIYLAIPPSFYERYKGGYLVWQSPRETDVFVDQKWAMKKPHGFQMLSIDSLARKYAGGMTLGLFQKEGIDLRVTEVLAPARRDSFSDSAALRKNAFFLNFSILAVLLLAGSFILLFRTNPRLTLDYLNISRLFSVQQREENLLTTRVTSSVNLLFYLFCSGYFAFHLVAIFYFGSDEVGGANYFPVRSAAEGFYQWFRLIIIVSACLGIKLALIYSFSTMFKLRDIAALQFFNYIRMLFFISVLCSLISLGYFIFNGYLTGPHLGLLEMSMVVMILSVLMIFLKLLTLAPFSFFHLFSYLCASEIIPLVIFLKVLLY